MTFPSPPRALCALVGEADAGKSNLLVAIRAVLDPAAAPARPPRMQTEGGDGQISIRVKLAGGGEAALEGSPEHNAVNGRDAVPPVLFLPAEERAGAVLADASPHGKGAAEAIELFRATLARDRPTSAASGALLWSTRSSSGAHVGSAVCCS